MKPEKLIGGDVIDEAAGAATEGLIIETEDGTFIVRSKSLDIQPVEQMDDDGDDEGYDSLSEFIDEAEGPVQMITSEDNIATMVEKIGYRIEDDGSVIDEETGEPARDYGDNPVNIDDVLVLVNGDKSNFVTNRAQHARYLAEKERKKREMEDDAE